MALWVIPNPEVTTELQLEIDRLAELHQAVSFLPHITAARLPAKTPDELVNLIENVSQRIKSHSISIERVRFSSKPYQKMVIQLKVSSFFEELSQAIDTVFQEPCSKNEFHCSLLYGYTPNHLLENEKQEILERLPDEWFARELAVILMNGGPDEWRIIHRKKLTK